jgi:hypothetical protein
MKPSFFRVLGILGISASAVVLAPGCRQEDSPKASTYTLTVRITGQGAVDPSGGIYEAGANVTLTATPAEGFRLSSWRGTNNDSSTADVNTVAMTADKTVDVTFVSTIIEDFEGASAAANWVFGNGPEFPGARGGFAVVAGRGKSNSKAGVLNFNFTGGGVYVIAIRPLADPKQVQGIAFWISGFVPGTRLLVRLTDESDQTFQYYPMIGDEDSGWMRITVFLEDWESYWGGSADGVFHGGLKSLGIGVHCGVDFYKTGDFAIDDVAELASAEIAFAPFGEDLKPGFYTGPVSTLIGVNTHFILPNHGLLDLAQQAGFGFVRQGLFWAGVETSAGSYDFSEYDQLLNALEPRGMGALFILSDAHPLYYDGPGNFDHHWGPRTPATRAAFAAFARAAAIHFSGRQVMLEIWNEPNIAQFWKPSPNPTDYALLVQETFRAVKGAVPSMPLVVGATSGCDAAFLDQVFSRPSLRGTDAVSIHPYRQTLPETFVPERLLVQEVIARRTGREDIPLYSGEWGYSATWFGGRTDAAWKAQAVHAIRLILINIRTKVPRTVWYDLQDDGSNPKDSEHNFGLLTNGTPSPKPAYNAVKALADLLPGRSGDPATDAWTIGAVDTGNNNVFGLVFGNSGGRLAALWTSRKRGSVEVRIPDTSTLHFYDLFGEPLSSVRREQGFCYVTLEGNKGPIYITD